MRRFTAALPVLALLLAARLALEPSTAPEQLQAATSTPTPVPTRTPAPEQCQGTPGLWNPPYCPFPEPQITVRSTGRGDNVMVYNLCVDGLPGLILQVRGIWYELQTHRLMEMPEAPTWRMEVPDSSYCEVRYWPTTWPGQWWMPSLRREWLYWAPMVLEG